MASPIKRGLEALERGRRFVTHDVWYIGRPGEEVPYGLIIKQVRVMILLVQNLLEGSLMLRAAALTFTTTLSIVPFLAFIFFVIQELNLGTDISNHVLSFFENQNVAAPVAGGGAPATSQSSGHAADPNQQVASMLIKWVFPKLGQEVDGKDYEDPAEWLLTQTQSGVKFRGMGTVGLFFVLTTVFGMMWNIESAFNAIWGLKATRSWFRILSDYMMVIIVLPFIVAGVLSVTLVLTSDVVTARLGILAYGLRSIQYIVIWLAFTTLYTFVPNTKVKWRYAILGGVIAGTLWCLTSWAYVELQIGLSRNSLFYSSFVLFPLLLTWIYFSWIILLFGAELTFAYQNEKTFAIERHAAGASQAYREAVALRAMVEICRRFDAGERGLEVLESAQEWNVPTRLLAETLDMLEEACLVRCSLTQPATFAPARSIHKITIGEVMKALREAGREPSALRQDDVLSPLLEEVATADNASFRTSLADLVHRFHPPRQVLPAGDVDDEPTAQLEDHTSCRPTQEPTA